MTIKICKNCILPETKPDLFFDKNGLCQGCMAYKNRKFIDWQKKEKQFLDIVSKKKRNKTYDCIIPVSGGKDSHFQVIKCLEYNINPLCVTAHTDKLSEIGRFNIENLKKLGVDHLEISTNPNIRRKINKFTLKAIGDISWAEHLTIFTIPAKVSCLLKIPLIIWGENPQNENGGPIEHENAIELNRKWLEEFGGLLGLRVSDLIEILKINPKFLEWYTYPDRKELEENQTMGLFIGQFFEWDGQKNAEIASKYGFQCYPSNVEGSIVNYENLDNVQMRVHDYFKYLKYGYDRVADWCSWHIRRGRLSREDALNIEKEKSGKYPEKYLGYSLEEILKEIDCTVEEFDNICDEFTNKELFKCDNSNNIIKRQDKSLIRNF